MLDQGLQAYILESRELLEEMETALLSLDLKNPNGEHINAIFRAAHTIKGSAGLFGLDFVIGFTHDVETLLDRIRDGSLPLIHEHVELLLVCRDHICQLVDAVEDGQHEAEESLREQEAALTARLHSILGSRNSSLAEPPAPRLDQVKNVNGDPTDGWHISARFGPDVLRNGMDPLSILRYLQKMGTITGVLTLVNGIPDAPSMDPESCYIGLEFGFKSNVSKAEIESAFEFVQDDSEVRILPPQSKISEYLRLIEELPDESARLGDLLIRCGTLTHHELQQALKRQAGNSEAGRLGEILVDDGAVHPNVVEAALSKQEHVRQIKSNENRTLRVDAEKLDNLIDLIGELIIASASVNLTAHRIRSQEVQECGSVLSGLVEKVRERALQLRMVKIGATFSRFQRVVHDVARELGKDITLKISGDDTELDKTLVERITDPLTHLVRNAIDHGIEPTDIRLARGKSARGQVELNAYHESGSIVIEVKDDGGGLDRGKILAKAEERGLIDTDRALSDGEVFNLIFEPGFSTAEKVTNLSGRGVGMDVVKRNISALRGGVDVSSEPGKGTTFKVRLPLTLAIINGFMVEVGSSMFIIPMEMIEECVACDDASDGDFINLRGQILPFVRLRDVFGISESAGRRQSIVVVRYGSTRAGIVVDRLLGEFQTVIKPLAKMFAQVKCISGSTILGSGELALILDVQALIRLVEHASGSSAPARNHAPGEATSAPEI
ncbi:chemotaxis protein CheA [Noviherbaspirillum galbum]|uniref:Chemotaxis protein CheA n=1 Tax=Noviherbaspirillum galbum TaxID=2709383 RepID=A0A6B3SNL7_9BURK|nr:chemotaxis protein CheA [Noviherbaspirillum galbum]NEX62321.1 chemotaxis protein CheA [Noviherbaspirillum galbum]